MSRPKVRQVLDCASPLVLWHPPDASGKRGCTGRSVAFKMRAFLILLVFLMLTASLVWLQAQSVRLTLPAADGSGWIRLQSAGTTNCVHILQASTNLQNWTEAAILHDGPFRFAERSSDDVATRFFRALTRPKTSQDDGKNQIYFPDDSFANAPDNSYEINPSARWVKFILLLPQPTRVWFQESARYPFHYDYAVKRLAPFAGMSRAQFDAVTLYRSNQWAVLGAVLFPPQISVPEFGIQFVGQDPYPREDVARWYALVREGVLALTSPAKDYYLPTFEQEGVAHTHRDWLAAQGIEVSAADRWLSNDACYSPGWALGRLVFVTATNISTAFQKGILLPTDILLTDAVPAEVPLVAGIITLAPATPNSHVAILSQTYGVPFVWPADATVRSQLLALVGHEVALRAVEFTGAATILDLEGSLTPELRQELLALKQPAPLNISSIKHLGSYSTNATPLVPADICFVGGKAAHFGLLRRTLPANSPQPALAFTFDLWDEFLDQSYGQHSLRDEIRQRLGNATYPPANTPDLLAQLAEIRQLIRRIAQFTASQQQHIIQALANAGFSTNRNIRFRSSTNVEDSQEFTGAGLYDSYSGCLGDDLDTDTTGPSWGDPNEPDERGVFRAIQRVYASFYNDNAYLARLKYGLSEEGVGMGVLVHYSSPDDLEMANGVATLRWTKYGAYTNLNANLVTQAGAVSVANPDTTAQPEIISSYGYPPSAYFSISQRSSLVPLGDNVLTWQADYLSLVTLLTRVANGYRSLYPAKNDFTLDFEYKKLIPGVLELKQVRPLPPADSSSTVPYLLNQPTALTTFQGEYGDVFSNHRLKLHWFMTTTNLRVDLANLQTCFYGASTLDYLEGAQILRQTGAPANWREAAHRLTNYTTYDLWTAGTGDQYRRYQLESRLPSSVTAAATPLLTLNDYEKYLQVTYAQPQPHLGNPNDVTTQDTIRLTPAPQITADCLLQTRVIKTGPVTVETRFYWPAPPRGATAGYTAPCLEFVETRLTGLLAQPMILHGYYAQTYHPLHHNFVEQFIFEPRLDPGLSADQLTALQNANIRFVYVQYDFTTAQIYVAGLDGKFRSLGP
jgi:hypothetical protein